MTCEQTISVNQENTEQKISLFQENKEKNISVMNENLSESENMKRNFYKKVYDCGNIKWILKNN